jgi:hypothetical protein
MPPALVPESTLPERVRPADSGFPRKDLARNRSGQHAVAISDGERSH